MIFCVFRIIFWTFQKEIVLTAPRSSSTSPKYEGFYNNLGWLIPATMTMVQISLDSNNDILKGVSMSYVYCIVSYNVFITSCEVKFIMTSYCISIQYLVSCWFLFLLDFSFFHISPINTVNFSCLKINCRGIIKF